MVTKAIRLNNKTMIKVSTDFGLGINLYRIFEYQKPDFIHMPLTCNELSHCLIQSQQLLQSSGLWSYPVAFNKENDQSHSRIRAVRKKAY